MFHTSSSAQSPFTYGQTYDFEVGDVMQTESFQGLSAPTVYKTCTILAKVYSANLDSISYVRKHDLYTYFSKDSTKFETGVDTLLLTNLNDTMPRWNASSSCFTLRDTFFSSYCNAEVWFIKPKGDSTCWNQHYEESWFIKGLGGPYYTSYQGQGDVWTHDLIYYKKASGSCGNFRSDIKEYHKERLEIKLFPNPTTGLITVELAFPFFGKIEIVNSLGEVVYSENLLGQSELSVNLPQTLTEGLYFVKLMGNDSIQIQKFLLK